MSDSVFDAAFARQAAGVHFRRADTCRDERAAEPVRPFEDFLRNLSGWMPPERESRRSVEQLAQAVDVQAESLRSLDDEELAVAFRNAVARLVVPSGQGVASANAASLALAPALACVAVGSHRQLGMWPHPVQLAGARGLLAGRLLEMQTGEGKTLVAALAATVMAASGARVHVISTNDYLAARDRDGMQPLFQAFGLDAGCIQGGQTDAQRRAAYACAICYASGKEVVFDYLKDRLAGHGLLPARVSQLRAGLNLDGVDNTSPLIPALHHAIVDEADSVMIDEARTPMILSRQAPAPFEPEVLVWAIASARRLQSGRDFVITAAREVEMRPGALGRVLPLPPETAHYWRAPALQEQMLRQALTALYLFKRDQQYIVAEGKVQIVDESTGRVMPDRSWEQGLHQLIETKEDLPLTQGRETLARMTYQRFFRRYYLLSGLTGTAAEAARELWTVYRLRVRRIPPNKPKRVRRLPDCCWASEALKWDAVATSAARASACGQAVLIGTRSVQASETVSRHLQQRGVPHVVLNARQDAEEAAIVEQAGLSGRITVATNMAGRGTDIRPDAVARAAGGLYVVLTEFHQSPRVDRQLFGRCARQGEPGTVQAIVSVEDSLFDKQPGWLRQLATGDGVTARWSLRQMVRKAQRRAERRDLQSRLETLKRDQQLHRLIGFAGRSP